MCYRHTSVHGTQRLCCRPQHLPTHPALISHNRCPCFYQLSRQLGSRHTGSRETIKSLAAKKFIDLVCDNTHHSTTQQCENVRQVRPYSDKVISVVYIVTYQFTPLKLIHATLLPSPSPPSLASYPGPFEKLKSIHCLHMRLIISWVRGCSLPSSTHEATPSPPLHTRLLPPLLYTRGCSLPSSTHVSCFPTADLCQCCRL